MARNPVLLGQMLSTRAVFWSLQFPIVSLRLLPVWPCFAGWIVAVVAVVAPALVMKIENIASHRTVGGSSRRLVGSLRGQAGSLNGSFAKCQGSSGKSTCRSACIHLQPDSCYMLLPSFRNELHDSLYDSESIFDSK